MVRDNLSRHTDMWGASPMVEQKSRWRVENEESLARDWEQRLQPRVEPALRPRRRVLAPWVRPVAWIAGLWVAAMVPSALAVHVIAMSYQYDQANQYYSNLTRQNQSLAAAVAQKTSPAALAHDAARLKVTMVQPHPAAVPVAAPRTAHHGSVFSKFSAWVRHLSIASGR